jgi:hypothetical protein
MLLSAWLAVVVCSASAMASQHEQARPAVSTGFHLFHTDPQESPDAYQPPTTPPPQQLSPVPAQPSQPAPARKPRVDEQRPLYKKPQIIKGVTDGKPYWA